MSLLAGICAGIAQVAIGHPFDTIKVRIQNKKLHFSRLYAGWQYPLVSSVLVNGMLFPTYEHFNNKLNAFWSGFISGAIVTPVVFVFDTYKINRQMYNKPRLSFIKTRFLQPVKR